MLGSQPFWAPHFTPKPFQSLERPASFEAQTVAKKSLHSANASERYRSKHTESHPLSCEHSTYYSMNVYPVHSTSLQLRAIQIYRTFRASGTSASVVPREASTDDSADWPQKCNISASCPWRLFYAIIYLP